MHGVNALPTKNPPFAENPDGQANQLDEEADDEDEEEDEEDEDDEDDEDDSLFPLELRLSCFRGKPVD